MNEPIHHVQFRDGTSMEAPEPPIAITTTATVFLDGRIWPIGEAFARLVAERSKLVTELDKARTALADRKAGETP